MQSSELFLRRWNEIIVQALTCDNTGALINSTAELAKLVNHLDSICIFIYSDTEKPVLLLDDVQPTAEQGKTHKYVDGPYLLNPFYQLCVNNTPHGVYLLRNLVSEDFWKGEHYKSYYQFANIEDEADYLYPISHNKVFAISMARNEGSQKFSQTERDKFWAAEPVFEQLAQRYNQLTSLGGREGPVNPADHPSLNHAIATCFESRLSERELEVVQLLLKGNSSKQVAIILDRSPDTIKAHRKHIYSKLGVSSIGDLFADFIQFLSKL